MRRRILYGGHLSYCRQEWRFAERAAGGRSCRRANQALRCCRFARRIADPSRIGIYGLSNGGYLTALGLARNSDIFKAGVDMAGVHNDRNVEFSQGVDLATRQKLT
ncbi:MAG TPA: prolyl oligopeptidase family serine peptidase [Candidatus Rubrimentiphilum sp.]|nr:prolyl oligopeptidase family serine peptidase [Candidatus Rubrimentiphilum sp.]